MNHISLLVGLGNPGDRYERTRHNAGFWFIDAVSSRLDVRLSWNAKFSGWIGQCSYHGEPLRLFKPGRYMNLSGGPVTAVCRYFHIEPQKMLVAHDDLDFDPGVIRLKVGGGHGGHNGLRSIIEQLGTKEFCRLRIGIGRPNRGSVTDYVLGVPEAGDDRNMRAAISRAADCLPQLVEQGIAKAMTLLHSPAR